MVAFNTSVGGCRAIRRIGSFGTYNDKDIIGVFSGICSTISSVALSAGIREEAGGLATEGFGALEQINIF